MTVSALLVPAERLAFELLGEVPERWAHSRGVAERAAEVAATVPPEDREALVAAAWLHDIGYAPAAHEHGFHPLDGALHAERRGFPTPICALIAHHSGARFVAEARGLHEALARYPFPDSPVMDALTYADQTVGPGGRRFDLEERLADMLRRHGPDSPNARSHGTRAPYLREVAARVQARLAAAP